MNIGREERGERKRYYRKRGGGVRMFLSIV